MRYALLIYGEATSQGGCIALGPASTATSVRVRGDETLLTDGPVDGVGGALDGFSVIEVDSLDDAIESASELPAARTGAVEVRPVHEEPDA
jgi:hypothetical protein